MGLFSTYEEVFERHFSSYSRKETSLYIENRSRVSWNDAFRCKTAASSLLNLRHFSDFGHSSLIATEFTRWNYDFCG